MIYAFSLNTMRDYDLYRFRTVLIGMLALAACRKAPDATQAATSSVQADTNLSHPEQIGTGRGRACPATGLWAICSVEKRLKQSGFVAQNDDSAAKPRAGFSVPPVAYKLNKSRLELYLYSDAAALQKDIATIDTVTVAPVFIRSRNLAALLFTDDATQAERLSLALTAGAPQASR